MGFVHGCWLNSIADKEILCGKFSLVKWRSLISRLVVRGLQMSCFGLQNVSILARFCSVSAFVWMRHDSLSTWKHKKKTDRLCYVSFHALINKSIEICINVCIDVSLCEEVTFCSNLFHHLFIADWWFHFVSVCVSNS